MSARSVLKIARWGRRQLQREMQKTKDASYLVRIHLVLLYHTGKGGVTIASKWPAPPQQASFAWSRSTVPAG